MRPSILKLAAPLLCPGAALRAFALARYAAPFMMQIVEHYVDTVNAFCLQIDVRIWMNYKMHIAAAAMHRSIKHGKTMENHVLKRAKMQVSSVGGVKCEAW